MLRHQRHLFNETATHATLLPTPSVNVTETHATLLHFKWLTRSDVWPVLSTVDATFQVIRN
jgi:hypothetical protein